MVFNSFAFFLFFPIVTILYFLLPHKFRWFHLLVASCVFYMAYIPVYILVLGATIVIDYFAGLVIERTTGRARLLALLASILGNVAILVVFKYFNFVATNINHVLGWANTGTRVPLLDLILPIGLSFHTFQAMSYIIEVYRGEQRAERNFGIYALYVMFYPQLVAGPIERPQNMLHQYHERHRFNYSEVVAGLHQMMWGMIKKVVIGDRLALIIDPIFGNSHGSSGVALAVACLLFPVELYCDFSGYSDIAIGAARVMGFKLMKNFNRPFISKTITEYWQRWHISLSTWFNEYIFKPITIELRHWSGAVVFGIIFTFLVSGLWHGAAWKYIALGLIFGVAIAYEFAFRKQRKKLFKKLPLWLNNTLSIILAYSYFTFACIFFRANSTRDALYICRKLLTIPGELMRVVAEKQIAFLQLPGLIYIFYDVLLVVFLLMTEHLQDRYDLNTKLSSGPRLLRWGSYYAFVIVFLCWGVFEQKQFIYFQF